MKSYELDLPGLAERVARLPPSARHEQMLATLRAADPRLANAVVATKRDGGWLGRRKVVAPDGTLIHGDHRAFLEAELTGAGSAEAVFERLRGRDYRLTQCDLIMLYVISDAPDGPQEQFVQAVVYVEDEFIDRRMFYDGPWWQRPQDLDHLCEAAEGGTGFEGADRARFRPSAYRLDRLIDMPLFLREAELVDRQRREVTAGKVLHVTDIHPDRASVSRDVTIAELDPDMMRYSWPGRRFFEDWASSSAGRSGARLCRHWVFQTSDYTDPRSGERWIALVPAWTHARKMAAIKPRQPSDYALYGQLESIDRRVGVPFAWYSYMLHGNLVESWAGERVLRAAEAGMIVLPEHDYQVLRRWNARPYGF